MDAILSTYYENIGDDLIRHGTSYLLKTAIGDRDWVPCSKSNLIGWGRRTLRRVTHGPAQRMVRPARVPYRLLNRALMANAEKACGRFRSFVIAGTPLFYFGTDGRSFLDHESWPRLWRSLPDSCRRLTLGVGSILVKSPEETADDPRFREFASDFLRRQHRVGVRDAPTKALLKAAAPEFADRVTQLPCPSLWAGKQLGLDAPTTRSGPVLVSFSIESASWSPDSSAAAKRTAVADFVIESLKNASRRIQLVSHNEYDLKPQIVLASKHGLPDPVEASAEDLLRLAGDAPLMVAWRVHGAMGALSRKVPTILFGTDTRAAMAVDEGAILISGAEQFLSAIEQAERSIVERDSTRLESFEQDYLDLIRRAFENAPISLQLSPT